jgi:dienelactone hydrolase
MLFDVARPRASGMLVPVRLWHTLLIAAGVVGCAAGDREDSGDLDSSSPGVPPAESPPPSSSVDTPAPASSGTAPTNPDTSGLPTPDLSGGAGGSAGGGGSADPVEPEPETPASEGLIRGPAPTAESAARPGPFGFDTYTSGLRDGPAYGTQTLHYPTDAEPPFASVVIVPGFVSPESSIRAWGPFLASHGIVTLTIGTNSGGDLPDVRATALLDAIETVKAENSRAEGPLEGALDLGRFAVMGWSMGGGGTLIAANEHPELKAAIPLAAWSPGVTFSNNSVPTLLFAGTADPLAGGQSQGFYSSIPEATPKMLYEVAGGAHDIANDPSSADGEIGLYGLSWMKVFLEGDERYRELLLRTPTREADFLTNIEGP